MKKLFFYAASAMVMMASCTNDEVAVDPVNPTPEESRVAIELGIDAPTVNAELSSRAMGAVGGVLDEENHWNSQKLYIAMYEKGTNKLATDPQKEGDDKTILGVNTHTYIAPKAPTQDQDVTNKGNIRIYQTQTYNDTNDNGTLKYEYYPVNGQFDFVGYHVDDLNVNYEPTTKTVNNIIITGQEDIMGAVTKELEYSEYQSLTNITDEDFFNDLKNNWAFSARTARNKIHPTLKFEHQLARLKFFVRAGSESAALKVYNETLQTWEDRKSHSIGEGDAATTTTEAMYVTNLTANNLVNALVMNLGATDENGKTVVKTTAAEDATADAIFTLGQYDETTKQITSLSPVAPVWPVSAVSVEGYDNGTPVGESIMFFPTGDAENKIELTLGLSQYLKMTEDETKTDDDDSKYSWATKTQNADLTIYAKSVKVDGQNNPATKFEPGKSYNVYITIYGFEKIEVSAELTAWEMGGDIEIDIEDKVSKYDVTYTFSIDQSNATIKFNGSDEADENKAITVKNGDKLTYVIECEGYETIKETITVGETDTEVNITMTPTTSGGQSSDNQNQGDEE